nr:TPM domain-containing protein [uncultured Sphingomonas sp.]
MRGAVVLGTLLAAGCGEPEVAAPATNKAAPSLDQGGRVIDLAGVLTPAEKSALGQRVATLQQADGRPVMVVILETGKGQSLEQVGWAVGAAAGDHGPLLLLLDPETGQVRLEGGLPAEGKAKVAAAMQPDLASGRPAKAIERGLAQLERMAS